MPNEENITNFLPSVDAILPKTNKDSYFLFYNNELLVKSEDNKVVIPTIEDLDNFKLINIQYFGSTNGNNCYCGELNKDAIIPNNMYFSKLKALTYQL
ncbi:MAG: NAD+ diphosphatase, partial [Clostridium sp.]